MFDIQAILAGMAPYLHYVSFGLLLLAGLNLPVSEDVVFIVSASLAATVVPEHTYYIFAGCFLGAYLSDIEAYLIGRYGINRVLFSSVLLRTKIVNREKIDQKIETVKAYFSKYGGKTLFFGRFIPFGMRNVLFMTSGLIHMNMIKFMIIDLCALLCTSSILFYLGYSFGNNFERIFPYLNRYKLVILGVAGIAVVLYVIRIKFFKRGLAVRNAIEVVPPKNVIIE